MACGDERCGSPTGCSDTIGTTAGATYAWESIRVPMESHLTETSVSVYLPIGGKDRPAQGPMLQPSHRPQTSGQGQKVYRPQRRATGHQRQGLDAHPPAPASTHTLHCRIRRGDALESRQMGPLGAQQDALTGPAPPCGPLSPSGPLGGP